MTHIEAFRSVHSQVGPWQYLEFGDVAGPSRSQKKSRPRPISSNNERGRADFDYRRLLPNPVAKNVHRVFGTRFLLPIHRCRRIPMRPSCGAINLRGRAELRKGVEGYDCELRPSTGTTLASCRIRSHPNATSYEIAISYVGDKNVQEIRHPRVLQLIGVD